MLKKIKSRNPIFEFRNLGKMKNQYRIFTQALLFKAMQWIVLQLIVHLTSQIKIKSSLYSPYYAEACNELRGPSPRLSAWAAQLRRNVATVASHCVNLTGPRVEP